MLKIITIFSLIALATLCLTIYFIYTDEDIREEAKTFAGLFSLIFGIFGWALFIVAFITSLIFLL